MGETQKIEHGKVYAWEHKGKTKKVIYIGQDLKYILSHNIVSKSRWDISPKIIRFRDYSIQDSALKITGPRNYLHPNRLEKEYLENILKKIIYNSKKHQ